MGCERLNCVPFRSTALDAMPAPLSADLRERILAACRSESMRAVARRFRVATTTVHRLANRDTIEPKPHGGGRTPTLTDADRPRFEAFLAENVSMPHAEMAARFEAETGRTVSRQTVQRHVGRWNLTRKKR